MAVTISPTHFRLLFSGSLTHSVPLSGLLAAPQTLLTPSGLGPLFLLFLLPQMFFSSLSIWLTISQPQERREGIAMVLLRNFPSLTWPLRPYTHFCAHTCSTPSGFIFIARQRWQTQDISGYNQGHNETKQLHFYHTQDKDESSDKTNVLFQTHLFPLGKLF